MRSLITLLAVGCSLFLFSCQKEVEPNPGPTQPTGTGGKDSTSYLPLTNGTWWKLKDSATGVISTGTVTNSTRKINNIIHTAVKATPASQNDTSWYAAALPNYYLTGVGVAPNGATFDMMFHFLNDTASVGYTWQYTAGQANGFTASIRTTILEKGITMDVAGKTYKNVIHTSMKLSYYVFGTTLDYGVYNVFTAKGIGIIKLRSELGDPLSGVTYTFCSDLVDYSIK